jgi:hypothetical protein
LIEGGEQTHAPAIVKEGESPASKIIPPVSEIGAEKLGARPVPSCLPVLNMIADHLSACTDSGKMAVGA